MTFYLRTGTVEADLLGARLADEGHETRVDNGPISEYGVRVLLDRPGTEGELAARIGERVFGNSLYPSHLANPDYATGVAAALRIPMRAAQAGLRVIMGAVWNGEGFVPNATCSCFGDETAGVVLVHQNPRPRLFQAVFERLRAILLAKLTPPNVLWVDATISRQDGTPFVSRFMQGYHPALWGLAGLCFDGLGGLIAAVVEKREPAMNTTDYCAYWSVTGGEYETFTAPSYYALTTGMEPMNASFDVARQAKKVKLYKRLRYL